MKGLIENVVTVVSFDIVRLRERLAAIDDPDMKLVMIVFTLLSDAVRFALITSIFAFFLL